MKRSFGRRWKKDERDKLYLLQPERKRAALINFRFWYPGSPLNQGGYPACVGYSTWKWLYSGPIKNRNLPFSPYQLYKEAQKLDEWPGENYDGTSVRGAFKFLENHAFVGGYRWAYDLETIAAYVLSVGPIVMGTDWLSGMMNPDDNGYINAKGLVEGGHAYLFSGANRRRINPDGTVGAFRVLNSWGASWGSNGRAWLSFSDVVKLMARIGSEACAATELKF